MNESIALILSGEADFPAIGASAEMTAALLKGYADLCTEAAEAIDALTDMQDLDEERERQQHVQGLLPAMRAVTTAMVTQPMSVVMPLFVEHIMNHDAALSFFEIMKHNNFEIVGFLDRVEQYLSGGRACA